MSHFRLARLCLLLAAVGLNTAPALMSSAHAQKADAPAAAQANTVRPELYKLIDSAQVQQFVAAKNVAELQNRIAQAEALPNKTPYEIYAVNRVKMVTASVAGDNAALSAAIEEVVKSGFEPKDSQAKMVLAIADIRQAQVVVVVGKTDTTLTLNLKAPIVINLEARTGRQVVASGDLPLQYELSCGRPPLRKSA